MKKITMTKMLLFLAIIIYVIYIIVWLSGVIPTYSSIQFLFRYMGVFLIFALVTTAVILRQYKKITSELENNTKLRNANIFTMVLLVAMFVGLSLNVTNDIKEDGIYPELNTCDFFDQYSNKVLGGNVEGECPQINVVTNTNDELEFNFTEKYSGDIYDQDVFNIDKEPYEGLYNRFGVVTVEYSEGKIIEYEIKQTVLVSFYYEDQTRYSYESGLYNVSNKYGNTFTSTRTQRYIHEFLQEKPSYDLMDYYDFNTLDETKTVLEVKGDNIYIDNVPYELEHNPTISTNQIVITGEFNTETYLKYNDLYLLENKNSTIFTTEHYYKMYQNPFTSHIHVEERKVLSPDLYVIKPISFGYCVEDRKDYGYTIVNNIFLLNDKSKIEYGYLRYELLLETHGVFIDNTIMSSNPILDYIDYN